jgi:hypothetical protein
MTPKEINQKYGATHYSVMCDGETPQQFYKQEDIPFSDGTSKRVWVYLSYANIWMGSDYNNNPEAVNKLKTIPT